MAGAMILSPAVPPTFRGVSKVGAAVLVLKFLLVFRLVRAMKRSGEL